MPPSLRICRTQTLFADTRCGPCVVRRILESANQPSVGLDYVLQRSESLLLAPKRALYRQGGSAEALYALRRGAVKLLRKEADGKDYLVRWVKSGMVIGLEAVLGEPYRHTAVAIEPVECCRIPLAVVRHFENGQRHLFIELMRQWQANLDEADRFVATLGPGSAEQRLARLLLRLGEMHDGNHCVSMLRSDLGAALGVSMETASRLMADFRRRGLIRGSGRDLVCNASALRALAAGGRIPEPRTTKKEQTS